MKDDFDKDCKRTVNVVREMVKEKDHWKDERSFLISWSGEQKASK